MQFVCPSSALMNCLSMVTRALPSKSTMPILEGILIEASQGEVKFTCTDADLGIQTTLPCEVGEPGRVVLPGKLFTDFVRKLPDAAATLTVSANNVAVLRCAGSRTTLSGIDPREFPELPHVEALQTLDVPQRQLKEMIEQTLFCVSNDESRPTLTGALLETRDGELRVVAIDGFRLALACQPIESPFVSVIVPGSALGEISRLLSDKEDGIALCFSRTHMHVEAENTRLITRLLEGDFIKYRSILPTSHKTRLQIKTAELAQSIERASLLARDSRSNMLRFQVEENRLIVTANSEQGEVYEEIPIDVQGDELTIAFNVKYMTDVLRAIDDEMIEIRFSTSVSPCLVVPTEGQRYLYMVLPVRLGN